MSLSQRLRTWIAKPNKRTYALGRSAFFEEKRDVRKAVTEIGVIADFLEATGLALRVKPQSLHSLPQDSHDAQFAYLSGTIVGVEVVELVDPSWALPSTRKFNYKLWTETEYQEALQLLVDIKQKKIERRVASRKIVSNYGDLWLLIHTGEPDLQFRKNLSCALDICLAPFDRVFVLGAAFPNPEGTGDIGTAWGEITSMKRSRSAVA